MSFNHFEDFGKSNDGEINKDIMNVTGMSHTGSINKFGGTNISFHQSLKKKGHREFSEDNKLRAEYSLLYN